METKKRFTDINKWRDPWFQELSQEAKLLWLFILDDCSPIGLYRYYPSSITFHTGIPEEQIPDLEIYNIASKKLIKQDHLGEKIYLIKDYVDFQYSGKKNNGLSVANAAHYGYCNEIREKGLWKYFLTKQRDVIAPKSIKYFYAVDCGQIDNTGKPTKRDIEELGISLSSIPDEYFNSDYESTVGLDSPRYVPKEKEKESDKEEKKGKPVSLAGNPEVDRLKKLLPAEDSSEPAFITEVEILCEALEDKVTFPLKRLILEAQKMKDTHHINDLNLYNLKLSLRDELELDIAPF